MCGAIFYIGYPPFAVFNFLADFQTAALLLGNLNAKAL